MEFFDLVNEIIDTPNSKEEFIKLLNTVKNKMNQKYIDYKNQDVINLNKKGYYILLNLINHKTFYDKLPDTPEANEFKNNGYIVIPNIKFKDKKIEDIDKICKNLFNISKPKLNLKKSVLKGPHKDKQNQLHMDRPYPTIKWFLYLNDVTEKNGAFSYVPKSHIPTKEKLQFLYKISCMGKKSPELEQHLDGGHLGAIRVSKDNINMEKKYIQEMNFESLKSLEYNKMTLIIADTTGFHKRGILEKNSSRIIMLNEIGYPKLH